MLLLIRKMLINCNFIYSWTSCHQQVITATPRQIESLIRLSEALARIRFSEVVCKTCVVSYYAD